MEINKFTLYALPFPSRAERVLWALKEFDYPHEVIRLDPLKGETATEEFIGLNPSGKVPVLIHDGHVFTESLAIMEYLNDLSKSKKLIPSEPLSAFNYRKTVHYGLTEIEPYLWIAEQATRLKPLYSWPEGTYEDATSQVKENLKAVWPWVSTGEYIVNDRFTLADIYFYQLIAWAKRHKIDYPHEVSAYLEKLEARTCFPVEMTGNRIRVTTTP